MIENSEALTVILMIILFHIKKSRVKKCISRKMII